MVDITHKAFTLRKAIASATLTVSKQETIEAIQNGTVPKGNIFEFSRAAGLLAIKKTYEVIPDCHPLPIEYSKISHALSGLTIQIEVEVHTIYKTGVEVEAMHGASIVALTMYDMLKPIDKGVEISTIRLVSKKGGKSDKTKINQALSAAVVVCSDSVFKEKSEDRSGQIAIQLLEKHYLAIKTYVVIPDDLTTIQLKAKELSIDHDLLVFVGGTGLGPRDVTPEALSPLIDRFIPGIAETVRSYGQDRVPTAMLSRNVAGMMGHTLVLTTPGSPSGVKDSIEALFPAVLHVFNILDGQKH